MVTGITTVTREAMLLWHLPKQKGTLMACFNQFISCFRNALWNLIYRHTDLLIDACIKIGLSKMQGYYKKTMEDNREEVAGIIRKRMDWHRLFRDGLPEVMMMIVMM